MRTARRWMLPLMILAAVAVARLLPTRPSPALAADTRSAAPFANDVDRIMGLLGNGQIDDVMASPNFLKDDPAARETVRGRLIDLRNTQAKYLGYDVVAVQRLSDRLQVASVLSYYDVRPVLFKVHFYKAAGRAEDAWTVIRFDIFDDVLTELKDVPTDYPDHVVRVRY